MESGITVVASTIAVMLGGILLTRHTHTEPRYADIISKYETYIDSLVKDMNNPDNASHMDENIQTLQKLQRKADLFRCRRDSNSKYGTIFDLAAITTAVVLGWVMPDAELAYTIIPMISLVALFLASVIFFVLHMRYAQHTPRPHGD